MEGDGVCKDKFPSAPIIEIVCTFLEEKEVHMAVSADYRSLAAHDKGVCVCVCVCAHAMIFL